MPISSAGRRMPIGLLVAALGAGAVAGFLLRPLGWFVLGGCAVLALVSLLFGLARNRAPSSGETEEASGHPAPLQAERLVAEFEQSGKGWFWETKADGTLSYLTAHVARRLGRDATDLIGSDFQKIVTTDEGGSAGGTERSLGFYLSSRVPFTDLVVRANTREEIWWSISGRPVHDEVGRFFGFRGVASDLTEKRKSEIELSRLARFDSLTGLANREMMRRALEDSLWSASRRKQRCAVFLMDLDRFKAVNDTLGHPVGDTLLKLVALRLKDVIGEAGQIGRLGGDEFQAVFPELADEDELAALAQRLIDTISRPYTIGSNNVSIGASVGIAISDYDERTADDLVRDADLALYAAKAAGKGTYRFFKQEMHAHARERQSLEADLRHAHENGELAVAYQPSVNLESGQVVGFEALVRWNHPTKGPISPSQFIPLAEETGLINSLGEWVLRTACAEAAKWPAHVKVAVNLSPLQFASPSLPALIIHSLGAAGLPANRLELEITEGVLLNDDHTVHQMIARLKALGVRLALDDFGTGYSSLGYLRKVPFDKIKIDQSFVRGASLPQSRNAAIIRAIVGLASELSMETTAEGVETQDELALIKDLGCSLVQGYIYGKPMGPEEAMQLLQRNSAVEAEGFLKARPERRRLIRSGVLHWSGRAYNVRLRNISEGGALVDSAAKIPVGVKVNLDLATGTMIAARTRWTKDTQVGLQFEKRLDLSTLATGRKTNPTTMLTPSYLASEKDPHNASAIEKERFTARNLR